MYVTLQYAGQEVEGTWISNARGCHLFYQGHQTQKSEMESVPFPPCQDHIWPVSMETIAHNMLCKFGNGLVLECKDGDMYATRYCRLVSTEHKAPFRKYYCGVEAFRFSLTKSAPPPPPPTGLAESGCPL